MSKTDPRETADHWRSRLYRNSYTYRGVRRWVSGWCVKIQWEGDRRTIRLSTEDREAAAGEAAALFRELRRGGWESVGRREGEGGAGSMRERGAGQVSVGVRKYVSDLHAGFERELFAEITHEGVREQMALGTEDPKTGEVRAAAMREEVVRQGWRWVRQAYSREVTVAVFWQGNPMTCTYTTLLSVTGAERKAGWGSGGAGRGWRVLVVEPDGPVRRALARGLAAGDDTLEVRDCGTPGQAPDGWTWHVALANRTLGPTALRNLERLRRPGDREDAWVLEHGIYADSDAIFASVSGVSRGYFLKRLPPGRLLEPLTKAFRDGPVRVRAEMERQVRRYFQATLEPADGVGETPGPSFSGREIQVLDLLGRGLSDKEIGNELGISVWTVHSHLKRIFGKYGVRTRTEAVVRHLQK